jgi:hypothetical protein
MNATFPVVLPNVWLPSDPVIDVMDAGMRDNYGEESSLRFLASFDDWLKQNTSGVLMLQIRDRKAGGWEAPYLTTGISGNVTKPFLMLQHNWFKMMEYSQAEMLNYYSAKSETPVHKISFQYAADKEENKAALNFHLTKREERDIIASIRTDMNQKSFRELQVLLHQKPATDTVHVAPIFR